MKKVAIVILNWNGKKLLEQFLPSIVEHTNLNDVELIVADNCSSDNSVSFLSENYPQIRLIILSENYGYAKGYNEALKLVDTEYCVLLNSDVEVSENWLIPALDYMDEQSDVSAVQPKILSYRNKSLFEYAGASGGFIDKYGYPFCRGRIFASTEKDSGQYDCPIDIFWASGACLIIRLSDFKSVGGFDSSFFAHMEEIDLCWRLNARGKRLVCVPQSVVYHVGAATLSAESPRKTFLNFRNNLLMIYKNTPEENIGKILKIRKLLDYIAIVEMLLSGKTKNAKAVINAHKEFNKIKQDYKAVQADNQKKATIKNINTIYTKSILWSFFIKRNKRFSDLHF